MKYKDFTEMVKSEFQFIQDHICLTFLNGSNHSSILDATQPVFACDT